jgi:esterase/lipase superfamily enzyme
MSAAARGVVTVFFATNRNLLSASEDGEGTVFGSSFNRGGVAGLRFGKAAVKVSGEPAQGVVEAITGADITVADEDLSLGHVKLGSETIFQEMQSRSRGGDRRTIVFIHGFNTSFTGALSAAARLHWNLRGTKGDAFADKTQIALFSWPSDASLITPAWGQAGVRPGAYYSDRIDAKASGAAFARGIDALIKLVQKQAQAGAEQCNQRLHLVAHSMGTFVLRHGLQELIDAGIRLRLLFESTLLFASDEDDDAFENKLKLGLLPTISGRVSIYHNRNDRALQISDIVKFMPPRLGSEGPLHPATLPRGVITIDVYSVVNDFEFGHGYYNDSLAVAKDFANSLDDTVEAGTRVVVGRAHQFKLQLRSN